MREDGERINRIMGNFDLEKCMRDGGKCQIWKIDGTHLADAFLALTDFIRDEERVLLVRYMQRLENNELTLTFHKDGSELGGPYTLRNLPEYKEVEVTLWASDGGLLTTMLSGTKPKDSVHWWKPYGKPVKVRFTEGL